MNKLRDIRAFARVAELDGFSAAARALGVSVSAVTKSVAELEADLGVQLFHRTTRHLHLTEPGRVYLERCTRLLRDLEDVEAEIRESNRAPSGSVRLCLPPAFGRTTVIPALGEFHRRHPDVRLEISLKSAGTNPIESGHDLIVHSGRLAGSGLTSRVLVHGPQKTVASPAYLERAGRPLTPDDLVAHNCIVGRFGRTWSFRDGDGAARGLVVSGTLSTDSGDAMREAALQGLGISQAIWWLFKDDIRTGALVPVLEPFEIEAEPISIVFPTNRRMPAKVRLVADFLLAISRCDGEASNT